MFVASCTIPNDAHKAACTDITWGTERLTLTDYIIMEKELTNEACIKNTVKGKKDQDYKKKKKEKKDNAKKQH